MEFGFGPERNYCAQFATNTLEAGGAKLKKYDMLGLQKEANDLVKKGGLLNIGKALLLIKKGPTPTNLVDDISKSSKGQFGSFKF